jgi:MoaA/NifB/PqqE/SkfB family radical SAM enzyme
MPTLPVFNLCNNRCWMCTNPRRYALFGSRHFKAANILGRLKRFREGEDEFLENYPDVFSLTGGEPTLSPDLLPVMNHIRRMFPRSRVVCLTNGRMFAYPSFTRKILSVRGDLELVIPVHGATAAEHDAITRTRGSFEQTVRGLDNILKERRAGHLLEIRIDELQTPEGHCAFCLSTMAPRGPDCPYFF